MRESSILGFTRRLVPLLVSGILAACGGSGSNGGLAGYDPGLPFGTDVVDAGADAAGKPDVAIEVGGPDVPVDVPVDVTPTVCTTDLACDDLVPCTADYCGDDGLCHHGVKAGHCLIEGVCVDAGAAQWGNACKTCQPAASPIAWTPVSDATCDDGDPCTTDTCLPAEGCHHEGACACTKDADCKPLDDDDKCNGKLRCLQVGQPPDATYACVPDLESVVTCDTSNDTPCSKTTCVPATGACVTGMAQEGHPCDDGDGCTANDACSAGSCVGVPCEDRGQSCHEGGCVEVPTDALVYAFDGDDGSFSGTDGWESQYCSDAWNTSDNGGVFPNTDDGCAIAENECTANYSCGWDWGYTVQFGYCQNSDPFDNHLTWGDKAWTDYSYSVSFKNDDDDTIGVVFRYTNSGQFYLLYFSRDQAPKEYFGCNMTYSGARLVRVVDQQSTLLVKSNVSYQVGQVHRLKVDVSGPHLTVVFDQDADGDLSDEVPLFDVVDSQPLLQGKVGLYAYENGATGDPYDPCSSGGCWFDDIEVILP